MSSIYKIQIDPLCKDHSLPFLYICVAKYCHCQVRLCEKCFTEHETDHQNSNLMKIDNFISKVNTEVQIVNKQQEKLVSSSGKKLNASFMQLEDKVKNQLRIRGQIGEYSMKFINQESKKVINQLEKSYENLLSNIVNIQSKRKNFPQLWSRKILENKLLETTIAFYSQEGFSNLNTKLVKSLKLTNILKDFLTECEKFGHNCDDYMISSSMTLSNDLSIRKAIYDCLKKKKTKSIDLNEGLIQFGKKSQKQSRKNDSSKENEPKRQKRSKTIFGRN